MSQSALVGGPAVALTITGVTANPNTDAIRALCKVIDDFQARVDAGETFAAVIADADIVVIESGDNPYILHKFQFVIGTDPDASPPVYNVDYVGYAATVATLPATPTPPSS